MGNLGLRAESASSASGGRRLASEEGRREPVPVKRVQPFITPLMDMCIKVIAENFESYPQLLGLPSTNVKDIISRLRLDLPLELVGQLIKDESYWKRRATARWKNCDISGHGNSWKQLYFETNLEGAIERFEANNASEAAGLKRLLLFSRKFVRNLSIKQLPSHMDLSLLFDSTASCLSSLTLHYGMAQVGMDYDRSLFGMKLSDCRYLAKALERTETLTKLDLSGNLLDDDKTRMVASGLLDNSSVTDLDLSHNKVADRGVRALAKVLDSRSVIAFLDLKDNQIHTEGAHALARALKSNVTLLSLNLRLNRVGDEGARVICDVLRANRTLQRLNISSNEAGESCAKKLAELLRENKSLTHLDVCSNKFGTEAGRALREALEDNTTLSVLDLRMCSMGSEMEASIANVLKAHQPSTDSLPGRRMG
eukprot:jgi/Mesvir1/16454/Mv12094-RA.1